MIIKYVAISIVILGVFAVATFAYKNNTSTKPPGLEELFASTATQEISSWSIYHNEFFGYQIRYPSNLEVSPIFEDLYGVGGDMTSVIATAPSIEISNAQTSAPLTIQIIRNKKGFSPEQWATATVKKVSGNIINREQAFFVEDKNAYLIEVKGVYLDKPSTADGVSTLDNFYTLLFIQEGDRIIRVSYPSSRNSGDANLICSSCNLYSEIVPTITFDK
ncbi:MAG: hypothetical protein FD167_2115 [bacterium]|nr:MAG: hypothetical protein FD167_2115 [bacterium]